MRFGPIPKGALVLHKCDNRKCVNHTHLYAGTNADNTRDKMQRGRHRTQKGAEHYAARLTEAQVKEMRALYASGKYSQQKLAEMYNMSKSGVGSIVRGETWTRL